MGLKTLYYFGLLILSNIILGQQSNSTISNGMEKELLWNSVLKECYSGPIVWSNCRDKGKPDIAGNFPLVCQL